MSKCKYKSIFMYQILLLFLVFNVSIIKSADPPIVIPNPPIVLSCGSDVGGNDTDGRKWESDNKFLPSPTNTSPATAQFQDPSLPSTTPYMSARVIIGGEASYKFPINLDGRYFLRLHFYPAAYTTANKIVLSITDSYFSATANGITLLNNFSAAITAEALTQAFIVREFLLSSLASDTLTLTLKPSDKHPKAFAFINGIELVAESANVFTSAANLVGFDDQSVETKSQNLQTIVRLNVGGSFISSTNDSGGMLRTWYDDTPYLAGANAGVTSPDGGANETLKYPDPASRDLAPDDVYRTWRNMGPDANLTKQYNLTWNFQVDPNFTYVVRMHFCDPWYGKVNQRVFFIYINNQSAIRNGAADVVGWAGGKMIPTYKDLAIFVNGDNKDEDGDTILSLGLHPDEGSHPQYLDAILNGLEIFKVNDNAKNLAGPNPTVSRAMAEAQEKSRDFDRDEDSISDFKVLGATGCVVAFGVAAMAVFFVYRKKKRYPRTRSVTSWLPIYGNSQTASKSTMGASSAGTAQVSSEAAANCRHFSLVEIKKATNHFDDSHVIGVGGFGKVYRGLIDGNMKVAIKRSNPSSEQGVHEFVTEIEMLSKLRHKHLVSLIGYCEEEGEMALYTIIHRDVKTTNILLDQNWVAKVSDFGLSKTGPDVNQNHVSTMVKGSFGYLDPEYFRRQQLTEKSDVYSFGVVLFEVLCARPALNPSLPKEQVSLADWSLRCVHNGTIEDMVDPHIKDTIKPECLSKYIETSVKCLSDHGIDRPTMSDLLWNLEFALQLQEGQVDVPKKPTLVPLSIDGQPSTNVSMHYSTLGLEEDDSPSLDEIDNSSAVVFSQIVHPTGRNITMWEEYSPFVNNEKEYKQPFHVVTIASSLTSKQKANQSNENSPHRFPSTISQWTLLNCCLQVAPGKSTFQKSQGSKPTKKEGKSTFISPLSMINNPIPRFDLNEFRERALSNFQPWQRSIEFWVRTVDIYTGYKVFQLRVGFVKDAKKQEEMWERQHEVAAEKIYNMCSDLGGFFLKVAQIIGKPDLAPAAWVRRLVTLCDQAPSTPYHIIQNVLEKEFGQSVDEVFETFEPHPLGSASIAQVHRAKIRGLESDVVVKVQHPGIQELMLTDLRNLHIFASYIQKTDVKFDFCSVMKEMEKQIGYEFDFTREAKAMKEIRQFLYKINKKSPVIVPRVIQDRVTRRVLVMEYINGVPILKIGDEIARRGIDPNSKIVAAAKESILKSLTLAYGQMILKSGFFHADPHPGNILICKDSDVALLDYGQVKDLPNELRLGYAGLVLAIADNDPQKAEQSYRELGIKTMTTCKDEQLELLRLAQTMFDTKLPPGVTMLQPFAEESSIRKIAVKAFPEELFSVLRTVHLLRGLSVGLGINYSCAEQWRPIAEEALFLAGRLKDEDVKIKGPRWGLYRRTHRRRQ
ncbi:hypothetical protein V2J09_006871 [Rumex salicifolius]